MERLIVGVGNLDGDLTACGEAAAIIGWLVNVVDLGGEFEALGGVLAEGMEQATGKEALELGAQAGDGVGGCFVGGAEGGGKGTAVGLEESEGLLWGLGDPEINVVGGDLDAA